MVDLNFTLIVQLLMFLGFLWAMNRWVLQPLLKFMDEREHQMVQAREQTEADQEAAELLEHEYAAAVAEAHRKAHQKVMEALQAAQARNLESRDELRRRQEEEVAEMRVAAQSFIERERAKYSELSRDLARAMLARLGMGDSA